MTRAALRRLFASRLICDGLPHADLGVGKEDLDAMEHDDLAGSALDFAIVAVLCLCAAFAIWAVTIIGESEIETLAPTAAEVMAADFDLERKLAEAE